MVLDAEEEVCDEGATQAIVPRLGFLGKGVGPGLADVRGIVCVIHVERLEVVFDGSNGVLGKVEVLGAWGAIEFASAAESGVRWGEGSEESVLVVGLGESDKGVPVLVSQSLVHAKEVTDARACLGEES